MKELNKIQEELNLLARQIEKVTRLEEKQLWYAEKNDTEKVEHINILLGEVYPSYLELRDKYLTE